MSNAKRFRFGLRTLFFVTILFAILLTGFVIWDRAMDQMLHDIMIGETGPVASREEWPRPLLEIAEEFEEIGAKSEKSIQVHCLCRGFDPEYVWRMVGDEKILQLLKDKWQLTEVKNPNWYVLNGYSHNSGVAPPVWWSPRQDGQTTFYVCPQVLAGEKGDRFQVAFDASRESVFVQYRFNF